MDSLRKWLQANVFLLIPFVLAGIGVIAIRDTSNAVNSDAEWDLAVPSTASAVNAAINPFDGAGIVYAVTLSSSTSAFGFLTIRDSDTANATSNPMVHVYFASNTIVGSAQSVGTYRQFVPPLRIYNGLSVDAVGCPTASGNTNLACFTVQYRTKD